MWFFVRYRIWGTWQALRAWWVNRGLARLIMWKLSQLPEYAEVDVVDLVHLANLWVYAWHAALAAQVQESGDESAAGYDAANHAAERMADLMVLTVHRGGENLVVLDDVPDVMGAGLESCLSSSPAV